LDIEERGAPMRFRILYFNRKEKKRTSTLLHGLESKERKRQKHISFGIFFEQRSQAWPGAPSILNKVGF
jgi:hypothetical protein